MISFSDLKKGVFVLIGKQPYEILQARPLFKGRGHSVLQTKLRNLITGNLISKTFHPSDTFEEVALEKLPAKFLYAHRDEYWFQKIENGQRFNLKELQLGEQKNFLKPSQIVRALVFNQKVINISLPIKICFKVTEAPPGIKAGRAEPGTKQVTLETGAKLNVPLFVEKGDLVEVNTQTGQYIRRVKKEPTKGLLNEGQ